MHAKGPFNNEIAGNSSTITIVKLDRMRAEGYISINSQGFIGNRLTIVRIGEAYTDGYKWKMTENTCGSRFELKKDTSRLVKWGDNGQEPMSGAPNVHRWMFITPDSESSNHIRG